MIFKDYYKILGFDTNRVPLDNIKIAFRENAKKYHPDVNIENRRAEERFKDINEAYNILSNSSSKRKYDRQWNTYIGKKLSQAQYSGTTGKENVFNSFSKILFGEETANQNGRIDFGDIGASVRPKKVPIKGDNVETEINIEIDDAFYGLEKKIALRTVNR